jgi:hypothetical protein
MMEKATLYALMISATLLVGICMSGSLVRPPMAASKMATSEKDIVDTAIAAGNFKTLVTAVQAAGLVDTLKSALKRSSLPLMKPLPR